MWGQDEGFLITVRGVLYSHIIFNTRWIWMTKLVVGNGKIIRSGRRRKITT